MTTQQPITPSESRSAMIQGLRRRLVGPQFNSAQEVAWPGPPTVAKCVNPEFEEKISYPTGPWVGPNQVEEVIPQNPLFVYPVGTLGPKMAAQAVIEGAECEEEVLGSALEDAVSTEGDGHVDVDDIRDADDGLDDDDAEVLVDSELEQGSIGLSIRVPERVTSLRINLIGGRYETIAVRGQANPWWMRRDVEFTHTFSTESSAIVDFADGTLTLTAGIEIRPQSDGTKICTIWAHNTGESKTFPETTEKTLFQARLTVVTPELLPYEPFINGVATSLDLLYQNVTLFSIGHGCDSKLQHIDGVFHISTESMPVVEVKGLTPDISKDSKLYAVGMGALGNFNNEAIAGVNRIIDDYSFWIADRKTELSTIPSVLQSVAQSHISECERFLDDIKAGWELAQQNDYVRLCLTDASSAMNEQRAAYGASLRETKIADDGTVAVSGTAPQSIATKESFWRPFQLAFILASLQKATNKEHPSRGEVDVIWMPTGGGKTEAYLGLAAFVMLWEKLTQKKSGKPEVRSTKVFMRYTLRLLTVQQITRAASLICALELIRRDKLDKYGSEEIRIGAWLGRSVTANTWEQAVNQFNEAFKKEKDLGFILRKCPWCGAEMGKTRKLKINGSEVKVAAGFEVVDISGNGLKRVATYCPDSNCSFARTEVTARNGARLVRGLPVYEVDEDVYTGVPDFVVGTIDKVARMAWKPESGRLFGIAGGARKSPPPSLFIQDELHLISGPLGSVDGTFETMLEHLCEFDGGMRPIIVAATATTKNFQDQVHNLYGLESRVIPPPGLRIGDSFFAVEDEKADGKVFVAVSSGSYTGSSKLQTNVLSALSHLSPAIEGMGGTPDPYWTNMVFFSSRRALGMLTSAVESTLKSNINYMHALTGVDTGEKQDDGTRKKIRYINRVRELTATSSEDVSQVLADLDIPWTEKSSISLCFATSMIEVGLDVPRLGLMTVMGQPKSSNQYIQVTGRVGRSKEAAGLIVTVLNPRVSRDRAHYEGFTNWHNRLYSSVESTSITPFTTRALERSTASVMTTMCRILGVGTDPYHQITNYWTAASTALINRASLISPIAVANTQAVLQSLYQRGSDSKVAQMRWTKEDDPKKRSPFAYAFGSAPNLPNGTPMWEILNSMRNVDQDANMKALSSNASTSAAQPQSEREIEL